MSITYYYIYFAVVDDKPSRERNSVFISYCPESNRKFNAQLIKFAGVLRNQGYTVYFPPFCDHEIRRCGGLDFWKEECIRKSEDIVVVCTPEYLQEDKRRNEGKRRNTKIEVDSRLLREIAYSSEHHRLIPVMLDQYKVCKMSNMPMWLQSAPVYKWPSSEEDLLFCLAKQSKFVIPPPTKRKVLKPIVIDFAEARKHNPYKLK